MALKLKKYVSITGTLRCKSGTRVGGSKDTVEIGGMDNPIIREPLNGLPYIPGSSIKGKLRSLLEYSEGKLIAEGRGAGEPCGCAEAQCLVCRVFGPHKAPHHGLGPTRLIVRDAPLKDGWAEKLGVLLEQGQQYVEVKTENMIDRRTGVATNPRPVERVPAGTEFDFNLSLRIFEGDKEEDIVAFVKKGLDMLPKDTLGGNGTRGYGWVELNYTVGEE